MFQIGMEFDLHLTDATSRAAVLRVSTACLALRRYKSRAGAAAGGESAHDPIGAAG